MNNQVQCYHCGLEVLPSVKLAVRVLGEPRAMCCLGCQAVAESIVENGLEDYYKHRTELPQTPEDLIPNELKQLALYDHPEVQKSFLFEAQDSDAHSKEAILIIEGITCAACIWLNERHLKQLVGIQSVAFNYGSHRVRIRWDEQHIKLSQILAEIRKLGYHAHPFSTQQQDRLRAQQRKSSIKRLAVAGLSAAQAMMMAVALYAGAAQGLEYANAQLLRWFSLVLTIPAITYCAWPFYRAAWSGLVNRQLGMDVPISLGILTGFIGSAIATVQGHGMVYFDTITMLICFLLGTRYLERGAREKSIEVAENLLRLSPSIATRVVNGQYTLTPVVELKLGDHILVKPGETIAADGVVIEGTTSVDESLLTGESRALTKTVGDHIYAGSINYESPVTVEVDALADNTMLASISRLLDRAQAEKPPLAETADRVAAYFTTALLVVVVFVALFWWQQAPDKVFEIVLTVLVVSCPCALSLAAPAAFAAAGSHLVGRGVLLTRGHALESLANVNHVVFDKTGTLTVGKPVLINTVTYGNLSMAECLKIAASLEQASEHPIAKSFISAMARQPLYLVEMHQNIAGQGVTGVIEDNTYRLGNAQLHGLSTPALECPPSASVVWLSEGNSLLAAFVLSDQARPDVQTLVNDLSTQQINTSIFSGDAAPTVAHFAQSMGITQWQAGLSPEQKLMQIRALQQQGATVLMVGDGINDAPVLAGANVSIAMGSGTQIARATGDVVLLSEQVLEIEHAIKTSKFAMQVIRQNFVWAIAYNLFALPFASMGLISPWMAAIGMSVSSLIVVLNALRIKTYLVD
ncbi:MAG TPA: heavy metal translocating P-type ATPase [Methylophilaceae bacterium]